MSTLDASQSLHLISRGQVSNNATGGRDVVQVYSHHLGITPLGLLLLRLRPPRPRRLAGDLAALFGRDALPAGLPADLAALAAPDAEELSNGIKRRLWVRCALLRHAVMLLPPL